jgi:hypothetical protein
MVGTEGRVWPFDSRQTAVIALMVLAAIIGLSQ